MRVATAVTVALLLFFAGAALPFLMVVGVLESTLFLSFLAYGSSVTGLVVGYTGLSQYSQDRR